MLYLLFVFSYVSWCPAQFPYRTMFISCISNTTDGTSAAGTAYTSGTPELIPRFCEVRVAQSLGFDFVNIVIVLCIFSLSNCIVYSFSIYNFWSGVQLPYDHGHDGLLMNKIQWEDKQTVNDTITGVVLKKYPKFNFISNNIPFVVLGYNDNHSIIPSSHPISV